MNALRLIPVSRSGQPETIPEELTESARLACASIAALYDKIGYVPPWGGYLAEKEGHIIGACAFKHPPTDGKVELAYYTFPGYEGQGHATAMAEALVSLTHSTDPNVTIIAQTITENCASTSLLKNLGFVLARTIDHPEDGSVWEWELHPQTKT